MNSYLLDILRCPKSGSKLIISQDKLISEEGIEYKFNDGIPDIILSDDLVGDAIFAREYYTQIASTYDTNLHITFDLYNEDENRVRKFILDKLEIKEDDTVLEISAGTGEDSKNIIKKLSEKGKLVLFDLTPAMLVQAKKKLGYDTKSIEFCTGSASNLPFKDNSFDKLYCFAGVGHFPNLQKALKEMARVVKPGGKVVFSEKNVPPWLVNTQYGKILINNNSMFEKNIPLDLIPVEARNLGLHWILGNVHYVIDYTVGEGEPKGNFDLEMPGDRGGTFNTRYFGKLEGVSPELKSLIIKKAKEDKKSVYNWLTEKLLKALDD
jgi:ubiquinone/menaquinone biosynthesis C-methylase UbiE/uncharacterized protein YbaR (Trm112 family)